MNEFDRRWKECVARARAAQPAKETAPAHLVRRWAAQWTDEPALSLSGLWLQMIGRALIGAAALLAVCAWIGFGGIRAESPFTPHVEDTVAQVFWML